jgi:hypothetical protein
MKHKIPHPYSAAEEDAASLTGFGMTLIDLELLLRKSSSELVLSQFLRKEKAEAFRLRPVSMNCLLTRFLAFGRHVVINRTGFADFLRDGFCLREEQQIIRTAGF